ncbi:hypothetical protein DFH07DRAFT_773619 [Mycena maculata]|uniref:Uncharacterized protein n=1 Tax=Mycena maculata TaxID=230809 RepID=A0AAD7J2I6_9AGAR|nr:hypothetical protein DFH07DRAFT_773619 [Mycena maculata]
MDMIRGEAEAAIMYAYIADEELARGLKNEIRGVLPHAASHGKAEAIILPSYLTNRRGPQNLCKERIGDGATTIKSATRNTPDETQVRSKGCGWIVAEIFSQKGFHQNRNGSAYPTVAGGKVQEKAYNVCIRFLGSSESCKSGLQMAIAAKSSRPSASPRHLATPGTRNHRKGTESGRGGEARVDDGEAGEGGGARVGDSHGPSGGSRPSPILPWGVRAHWDQGSRRHLARRYRSGSRTSLAKFLGGTLKAERPIDQNSGIMGTVYSVSGNWFEAGVRYKLQNSDHLIWIFKCNGDIVVALKEYSECGTAAMQWNLALCCMHRTDNNDPVSLANYKQTSERLLEFCGAFGHPILVRDGCHRYMCRIHSLALTTMPEMDVNQYLLIATHLLCAQEWAWDKDEQKRVIFHADGTGEAELVVIIVAGMNWMICPTNNDGCLNPRKVPTIWRLLTAQEHKPTTLLEGTLEITLNKSRPLLYGHTANYHNIERTLLEAAFQPRWIPLTIEGREFQHACPYASTPFGLRLAFGASPYPPLKMWSPDTHVMVESQNFDEITEFCARRLDLEQEKRTPGCRIM